jgi:hypothetical protein
MKRIGILAGRERSFPNAFIERVNHRDAGVVAEWVKLGGTALGQPNPYSVIVDRISHEVPYYALYLKDAQAQGIYVVNDPYRRSAEDKFAANAMAVKLGVAVPKTIVLPNHDHIPDITPESLSNLMFPLDWGAIARYIGLPAVMKPALGGGWKSVSIVHSIDDMIAAYDASGELTMLVQEFVHWDRYVRCICIGREKVLPVAWDPSKPHHERYLGDPDDLEPELRARIESDALALCRGLGYDMNTVEFAVRDGVPVAIDFTNSAPDFDITSLGPRFFDWVLEAMTELVLAKAAEAPFAVGTEYGARAAAGEGDG